jgi:hypothetical protein
MHPPARNPVATKKDLTGIGQGLLSLESPADRRRAVITLLNSIKHLSPDSRAAAVDAVVEATGTGAAPSLMMTSEQVRRLGQLGMDVGAHTSRPSMAGYGKNA